MTEYEDAQVILTQLNELDLKNLAKYWHDTERVQLIKEKFNRIKRDYRDAVKDIKDRWDARKAYEKRREQTELVPFELLEDMLKDVEDYIEGVVLTKGSLTSSPPKLQTHIYGDTPTLGNISDYRYWLYKKEKVDVDRDFEDEIEIYQGRKERQDDEFADQKREINRSHASKHRKFDLYLDQLKNKKNDMKAQLEQNIASLHIKISKTKRNLMLSIIVLIVVILFFVFSPSLIDNIYNQDLYFSEAGLRGKTWITSLGIIFVGPIFFILTAILTRGRLLGMMFTALVFPITIKDIYRLLVKVNNDQKLLPSQLSKIDSIYNQRFAVANTKILTLDSAHQKQMDKLQAHIEQAEQEYELKISELQDAYEIKVEKLQEKYEVTYLGDS
jgi:hypothetical protein